ncbi:MAG: hypothetical protein ACOC38_03725 [Promethearchaeia archaeon]
MSHESLFILEAVESTTHIIANPRLSALIIERSGFDTFIMD